VKVIVNTRCYRTEVPVKRRAEDRSSSSPNQVITAFWAPPESEALRLGRVPKAGDGDPRVLQSVSGGQQQLPGAEGFSSLKTKLWALGFAQKIS